MDLVDDHGGFCTVISCYYPVIVLLLTARAAIKTLQILNNRAPRLFFLLLFTGKNTAHLDGGAAVHVISPMSR
jgi:hypothetical protein